MSIKDIELRFVERAVPAPEHGENIFKTARILQSRKLVEQQWHGIEYRDGFELSRSGLETVWTEWQDVPVGL